MEPRPDIGAILWGRVWTIGYNHWAERLEKRRVLLNIADLDT
jgi:hypothetical protein